MWTNLDLFVVHLIYFRFEISFMFIVGCSEDKFREHMNDHYKSTCSICGYRARTEGRLKRHLIDAHADSAEKQEIDGSVVKAEKKTKKVMKRTCRLCKFTTFEQVDEEQYGFKLLFL